MREDVKRILVVEYVGVGRTVIAGPEEGEMRAITNCLGRLLMRMGAKKNRAINAWRRVASPGRVFTEWARWNELSGDLTTRYIHQLRESLCWPDVCEASGEGSYRLCETVEVWIRQDALKDIDVDDDPELHEIGGDLRRLAAGRMIWNEVRLQKLIEYAKRYRGGNGNLRRRLWPKTGAHKGIDITPRKIARWEIG